MSKQIKQLEMDALKDTFKDIRDLVVLSVTGVDCQADNKLRLSLRKKNIRLQVVKNSLARRVFDDIGIRLGQDSPYWAGSTVMAYGGSSLAELSRAIDAEVQDLVKKNPKLKDRVQFKGAVADGQAIGFAQALKMPTWAEAIARIISLTLAPASRLVGQLKSPAGRVAAQIKTLSEKTPETAAPPSA
jgi:large subunit ribosomal protein L10